MGIHTWIRYCSYELHCLETLKNNLDLFCFGCHTSDDVGGCHNCGIGRANRMCLDYLKENLLPNKKFNKLYKECIEHDGYIRLRPEYRVKKAAKKYVDQVRKTIPKKVDQRKWAFMIQLWARNTHECQTIKNILEDLKKAKTKY